MAKAAICVLQTAAFLLPTAKGNGCYFWLAFS